MSETLRKIAGLEKANLIPQETEEKINKLLSVKRTSQWYLLDFSDEDCQEIESALSVIETKINTNNNTIGRVQNVRHESIAILLDGEDFI